MNSSQSVSDSARPDDSDKTIRVPAYRLKILSDLTHNAIRGGAPSEERAMLKTLVDEFEHWMREGA